MKLIPDRILKLWHVWDLRVFVLVSLLLQTLLIFLAPLRKRKAHKCLTMLIWSAYLLADWIAGFALGLISNSQGDATGTAQNDDLIAFWAPFLLLHLGGPDTITAFALEDNELWLRHLFGLLFQLGAAGYIFIRSLPTDLWVLNILMFVSGLIKYAERTRSLYLASLSSFRDSMLTDPDPGPNYAKLMEEYASKREAKLPTEIEMIKEPETNKESIVPINDVDDPEDNLKDIEMVKQAYKFFEKFKGLIVDLIFSFQDRNESRDFFLQRKAKKAFRVIEIELSFMYEVLYTKVEVVHSRLGYILRVIYFGLTVTTLLRFQSHPKDGLAGPDVYITYALLIGAISLDCSAFLMLVFSDWTIAAVKISKVTSFVFAVLNWVPMLNTSRWSNSISQFNLITFCLLKRPKWINKILDTLGIKEFLDEIQYKSKEPVTEELKQFIFWELKRKSKIAVDSKIAKEICSARGDWVLSDTPYRRLLGWSVEVEYDESLLLWHIATEICYRMEDEDDDVKCDRDFCKLISDYMLYLLVMQPTMMSAVAGIGQIRYRDTCAEALKFFLRLELKFSLLRVLKIICRSNYISEQSKEACFMLHNVNTVVKPADVKGDRSKSVLFDAVRLAKNLEQLKKKKWKIMSKVWLELMSYAAGHCRANTHAQQLSKGGELLTFVWLLMAHLGLGEQFRIEAGHARAKLIVGK